MKRSLEGSPEAVALGVRPTSAQIFGIWSGLDAAERGGIVQSEVEGEGKSGDSSGILQVDEEALRESGALLDEGANLIRVEPERPATGLWALAALLSRGIDAISGFFGKISQVLVFFVFAAGILNVTLRYIGRAIGRQLTSNLWIEAQWYLFALIALLGLAVGIRDGVNPRVDFWYADFSVKKKAAVDLFFHWGLLAFSFVAVRLSLPFFERSFTAREGSPDPNGLARWPLKSVIILAFALFLLQVVSEIIKSLLTIAGRTGRVERSTPYRVE